jgi:hypothetical protein
VDDVMGVTQGECFRRPWPYQKHYGIEHKDCSSLSCPMIDRDFRQLQEDLEATVSKLKRAEEAKLRRDLLLEMRLLLAEADRLLLDRSE